MRYRIIKVRDSDGNEFDRNWSTMFYIQKMPNYQTVAKTFYLQTAIKAKQQLIKRDKEMKGNEKV